MKYSRCKYPIYTNSLSFLARRNIKTNKGNTTKSNSIRKKDILNTSLFLIVSAKNIKGNKKKRMSGIKQKKQFLYF